MIPLIITPVERAELQAIARYAEDPAHWWDQDAPGVTPIGNRPEHRTILPSGLPGIGWSVVYSIDTHPGMVVRHLSMTIVGAPGRVPGPESLEVVAEELGWPRVPRSEYIHFGPARVDPAYHLIVRYEPPKPVAGVSS